MEKKFSKLPEIWGGIECSYNRVGDNFFDQLQYNNHYQRIESDIALFSELGIQSMRYPIIWERLKPRMDSTIDWTFTDRALKALKSSNIKPIAGLVHHGSGPLYADILHPEFPNRLAEFARQVALRYPWIEYYTPVNEPLTTARFCCLYGFWFPHQKDDKSFVRALLNELKGVVLSMKAIREVNPHAKLIQTEDLAKVYSTPLLRYQADFENQRRWLTYDLLCGKVNKHHTMANYLMANGMSEGDFVFFQENHCPPDIIGLDYYATSERYLDENISKYPPEKLGGNNKLRYADVEAVRIRLSETSGPKVLISEVWERYHIPLVLTEVHINCDEDNKIRWFGQIRNTCIELINKGVDLRALTTWAMLGSYGWNRLLTNDGGDYEAGAFDMSSGTPSPTPLAEYISRLSEEPEYVHSVMSEPGWWQEEYRLLFENEVWQETPNEPALKEDCAER
ncbi:family 1 glycosylhydrolase [Chryseosolibacter indicus]|uniref:Family 1 glycosylhydrolase n=1 Tax=Chryseosolibacter indicus TaxID=2782351 RepID=A0ABS5VN51_9BACT|nr:family 1 glycosylhydrolase [Chryseosolibacter indicus]MBT1702551.1 family 1 glycosylhydrolase [Chryseosolibacter indicus]